MNPTLNLRIHSVKCIDETGGSFAEKFGDDEIYLGGFTLDSNAKVTRINMFSVYSAFDDGDVKKYFPPKLFASFPLPYVISAARFYAGFLLVEKDSGGQHNALVKLVEKVATDIKIKKEQAGNLPVGLLWDAIKPDINKFVTKMLGMGDDLFPLQNVSTFLSDKNHNWHGRNISPVGFTEFRGHSGVYQLLYDWELA